MPKKTIIGAIVTMMETGPNSSALIEAGPEPISGMGDYTAVAEIGTMADVGMAAVPKIHDDDADNFGFHRDDYTLAKQLVSQVGGIERVRELLENLDEVYEILDIDQTNDDEQIAYIAGHVPDELDFPTNHQV